MNDEQLKEAGVPAELIRISLGLEDKVDLIADISKRTRRYKIKYIFIKYTKRTKLVKTKLYEMTY